MPRKIFLICKFTVGEMEEGVPAMVDVPLSALAVKEKLLKFFPLLLLILFEGRRGALAAVSKRTQRARMTEWLGSWTDT